MKAKRRSGVEYAVFGLALLLAVIVSYFGARSFLDARAISPRPAAVNVPLSFGDPRPPSPRPAAAPRPLRLSPTEASVGEVAPAAPAALKRRKTKAPPKP